MKSKEYTFRNDWEHTLTDSQKERLDKLLNSNQVEVFRVAVSRGGYLYVYYKYVETKMFYKYHVYGYGRKGGVIDKISAESYDKQNDMLVNCLIRGVGHQQYWHC